VGPHLLQSKIHSSFSADSAVWESLKSDVISTVAELNPQHIYYGHILREFNRKVITFGFNDLTFSPYDSGFRYSGDTITASTSPEAAYVAALTAAGATVTAPQQAALSAFISGEIAAGRWDKHKRIYLPVWQLAAANAICMKSLTSGTFSGSILHEAKGVRVTNTNGNMNTNTNLGALGITKNSFHFAMLLPDGAEENYSMPFNVNNEANLNSIYPLWSDGFSSLRIMEKTFSGTSLTNLPSIMTIGNDSVAGNLYFKEHLSGSTGEEIIVGSVTLPFPSANLFILGRSSDGAIGMNFPIGAFSTSTELSSAQDVAYVAALKTLWEACTGLTLP
jgi:hypothetical protein